jgi:ADP-Ribosyltransferase in polyvalent proteins
MEWYKVIKTIKGRRYHYLQRTHRQGKHVRTENKYIGPVNDAARPTYYHGTLNDFDEFSTKYAGVNTGWKNAGFGIFFSDAKRLAMNFAEDTRPAGDTRSVRVKEVSLDLKNPLDLTIQGIFNKKEQAPLIVEILGGRKMLPDDALASLNEEVGLGELPDLYEGIYADIANKKIIQNAGYDGIVSEFGRDDAGDVIKEYVVFEPSQIKLVTKK